MSQKPQVEDLFYNVPSRRRAFRSASEEYAKILDLVGRYAVHCIGVSFSCKKHGDSGSGISVPMSASIIDRIRQIHGSTVANELIQFDAENPRWGFKCKAWISNANYSAKRTTILLFINHRSVESTAIKKAIEQTYGTFLPKGGHPFVYLSLDIEPQRVDVNVHPTKREVHFLNEDEIIAIICEEIRNSLSKVDTSRSFMTQSLLSNPKVPSATPLKPTAPGAPATPNSGNTPNRGPATTRKSTTKKPYENNLVRTDASARKITSMLQPRAKESTGHDKAATEGLQYTYTTKEPILCRLTSIKELRAEVRDAMHNELTDIIASHTFIGIVDSQKRIAAIQGGVKLYLVDYGLLCNEYFYQVGLTDFGNFGSIKFDPPLPLDQLLQVAVQQEEKNCGEEDEVIDWEEVADQVSEQIMSKAEMLKEYFSMELSKDGELVAIPLLMKGYMPCLAKLPQFLLRLGPKVDWTDEKACFHTFLRELASFYVPECLPLPPSPAVSPPSLPVPMPASADTTEEPASTSETSKGKEPVTVREEDPALTARRKALAHVLENDMFPAFKARLVATKGMLKGVMEVANLKGLYRVFERC